MKCKNKNLLLKLYSDSGGPDIEWIELNFNLVLKTCQTREHSRMTSCKFEYFLSPSPFVTPFSLGLIL